MAGSLADETHDAAQPDKLKTATPTGKCEDKPSTTTAVRVEEEKENKSTQEALPGPAASTPPPALTIDPPPAENKEETAAAEKMTEETTKSCRRKLFQPSSKSASSLPARAGLDEMATSSLGRRGRAQSYLTLYNGGSNDLLFEGDARGLDDSIGARSELSAPVSGRRRRQRAGDRAYGTLERATSYSSLISTPQRPTFRSANSTRPPPAPPCTTTHLDFSRHPVDPAFSSFSPSSSPAASRLARSGTPRRNNPHPVGLHFQSPYNREGKTYEVWNLDENILANRLPQMCKHIERTNFTSGKVSSYSSSDEGSPSPERVAGLSTMYQMSYRSPQGLVDHDRLMPTTHFGSTRSRVAAVGIVPNVMSSGYSERRVKLHVPRGQKLESLV